MHPSSNCVSSQLRNFATFLVTGLFVVGLTPSFDSGESASASNHRQCSSGTSEERTLNGDVIISFSAPASGDGNCTFVVPENVFVVEYLVVAGGGGGGSGGGGGGGVVTSWANSGSPMTVEPGTSISVTIGAGGSGGAGGSPRYSGTAGTNHHTVPSNGNDSVFGSVRAIGGGAGGHFRIDLSAANRVFPRNGVAGTGGSSGGQSFDLSSSSIVSPSTSTVVGAASFGNAGGASPQGSYSSGGGGGGAGGAGGNARQLSTGCGAENCTGLYHGGGNGGAGISLTISGVATLFGCGGGGGVNSNTNNVITGGGGAAGCSTAGRGSNYGNHFTNYSESSTTSAAMATAGAAGFGGGGGGTDPEDYRGQNGGSGVVVIRYTPVDTNCTNRSPNPSTPLACPDTLEVVADGTSTTFPIFDSGGESVAGSGATLAVRSSPRANPATGSMTVSVTGGSFVITVPAGSSLIGGTYPVTFRINQSGTLRSSYIRVTVEDPEQLTPGTIPLDPRNTGIVFPRIEMGVAPNIQLCLTFQDQNNDGVAISVSPTTGVTITSPSTRRVVLTGTNANVESAASAISLTSNAGSVLVPSSETRVLDVNVSNTNNGGNGSCSFGTSSTITLRNLRVSTSHKIEVPID